MWSIKFVKANVTLFCKKGLTKDDKPLYFGGISDFYCFFKESIKREFNMLFAKHIAIRSGHHHHHQSIIIGEAG